MIQYEKHYSKPLENKLQYGYYEGCLKNLRTDDFMIIFGTIHSQRDLSQLCTRYLYTYIYWSILTSQLMGLAKMSVNRWIDNKSIDICTVVLPSAIKKNKITSFEGTWMKLMITLSKISQTIRLHITCFHMWVLDYIHIKYVYIKSHTRIARK